MKTTIIMNIKHNTALIVKESVDECFLKLLEKGSFVKLTQVRTRDQRNIESAIVINKGSIKMIREK